MGLKSVVLLCTCPEGAGFQKVGLIFPRIHAGASGAAPLPHECKQKQMETFSLQAATSLPQCETLPLDLRCN